MNQHIQRHSIGYCLVVMALADAFAEQPTVDITPVLTTNNAVALQVVTTNNLSILTTNNSQ